MMTALHKLPVDAYNSVCKLIDWTGLVRFAVYIRGLLEVS